MINLVARRVPVKSPFMGYHSITHSGSHSGSSSDISSVISLDSGYRSQISGHSGQSSLSGDT